MRSHAWLPGELVSLHAPGASDMGEEGAAAEVPGGGESVAGVTVWHKLVGVGHVWPSRKLSRGEVQLSNHLRAEVNETHTEAEYRSGAAQRPQLKIAKLSSTSAVDAVMDAAAVVAAPLSAQGLEDVPAGMLRALVAHSIQGRVFKNGSTVTARVGGRLNVFVLTAASLAPDAVMRVAPTTRLSVALTPFSPTSAPPRASPSPPGEAPTSSDDDGFLSVGGLDEQIAEVRRVLEAPLAQPELFQALGVRPPRGVLLFGPPGTGKTLIAKAFAKKFGASMFVINGPEVYSRCVLRGGLGCVHAHAHAHPRGVVRTHGGL